MICSASCYELSAILVNELRPHEPRLSDLNVGHMKQTHVNHSALYADTNPCYRDLQHFSHHLGREHILDVQPPQKRRQIIAISILIQKLVKKFTGAAHVQNASNSSVYRYKVGGPEGEWSVTYYEHQLAKKSDCSYPRISREHQDRCD